jgi:hypothetical protein
MASTKSLATVVQNRFKFAKDQQQTLFEDYARFRQLWRSKIVGTSEEYPWDYALFHPMVFSTVRSFVSRVATGNVGFTLQAWNEKSRPKTEINKSLLEWEIQECEFFLKVARWVFSAVLYGKGFMETGWLYRKERKIVEEEEKDGKTKTKREFLIAPMINRADLSNVRVFDMVVANRNIPDLQKQPWIGQHRWVTLGELEDENEAQGKEVYKNLKKIRKDKMFVTFVDYGQDVAKSQDLTKDELRAGVIHLMRHWDRSMGTEVEIVADHNEFTVKEDENKFYHGEYPYSDLTFFPEDDEFWSTGAIMPIEDLQIALNSVLNQYMTNARQQMNNMWITDDAKIPPWEFISRPNGVIHKNGGELKEVQHKDITNISLNMMAEIKTAIQRTTGISDTMSMGAIQERVRGAAMLQQETDNLNENLRLFMGMLEQVGIKKIAEHFLKNNQQFITSEQTIKITGRHGYSHVSLKPDDVSCEFDPIIIPESTIPKNNVVRAQNLQNTLAMAQKEQKVNINTTPIWRELVSVQGLSDLDEIVPDDTDEAYEENDLLKKGQPVECEPNDNHDRHIAVHQYCLIAEELKGNVAQRFIDHIKQHKLWKLAADPDLLEKLAAPQGAPSTTEMDVAQNLPGQAPDPLLAPGAPGVGQLPNPNPAVGPVSLARQAGQDLAVGGGPVDVRMEGM